MALKSALFLLLLPTLLQANDLAIREAREAFNLAIEQQDTQAIGGFLMPEYHIVTGRSDQFHGAAEEPESWKSMFEHDPSFVCRRSTRETSINDDWGLAEELGDWKCNYTTEGEAIESTGVYAAKWQRAADGRWLLQSEVFTTLTCKGNEVGCRPPDSL